MATEIDHQAGTLTVVPEISHAVDEKMASEQKVAHVDVDRADGETIELSETVPTEDELNGANALKRVSAPIPWAVYTVAFVELCERFSYYGTQVVCEYS